MFSANNIIKSYDGLAVLNNISLSVEAGDCLAILGDNGCGKSTLMAILADMLKYNSGEILYNQKPITKDDRLKIGYVPQQPILIDYLTVNDNLKLWASIYNKKTFDIPDFLNINSILKTKAAVLSGGMRKRVAIAIALINNPEVLILDEAFAALDSKTAASISDYLQNSNMTIIYSSHNILEITQLCNKIIVLKNGVINYYSQSPLIANDENIKFLYSQF